MSIHWRRLLAALVFVLAGCGCITRAANRPNILFLLADDQRADTISALGNPYIQTPYLDQLARHGFAFTRAYNMGAQIQGVCVPSRAMMLTGRGLYGSLKKADWREIPRRYLMWPEVLRAAGYQTIGIGKWHNDRPSYTRAFSAGGPVFFGGMGDHNHLPVHDYNADGVYNAGNQRLANRHSSELFADAAIAHIRKKGTKPFAMYVAFTAPHDPRQAPPAFMSRYSAQALPLPANFMPAHPFDNGDLNVRGEDILPRPLTRRAMKGELAAYYAMITHLDAQIGRILKALRETGLDQNTIIIYAADNGLAMGSHGLLGKGSLYEHSVRVPLLFSGPGIPAGSSSALCYLYDVYPTLCQLAGVKSPTTLKGTSLLPIMRGEQQTVRESIFCAYLDVQRMVCNDRWKLIYYPKIGRLQLFDLANDPDEMSDLSMDGGLNAQLIDMIWALGTHQWQTGDPLGQAF